MDDHRYRPQSKVDWASSQAYPQFRLWRKELERILNGPMNDDLTYSASAKLNTVYIWAGAHAETLVEACQSEDPTLKIETAEALLNCLAKCLTTSLRRKQAFLA